MGCAHREKTHRPAAYRAAKLPPFPAYRYSRPFCAAVSPHAKACRQSGAKTPAPTRKKSQSQNCSVPLRSSPQFPQPIHAALFCAALPRSIKGRPQSRDKKVWPRLYVKSTAKRKHGGHPKALFPNPARRPAGRGQARGANPSRSPLPVFSHKP
jgi:hypothetical protein